VLLRPLSHSHSFPMFTCSLNSIPRSDRAHAHVRTLATLHPRTKFVSIVGDKCIPNLPDSRVPMFIVYRKGQIVNQIMAWGSAREPKLEGRFSVATFT
jgi:hypothetical protein